jgi:ribosome-associated heat shock protein Hsp15
MDDQEIPVRIDKWLWAARFFKTRSLASKAVSGGKVYLNGQRVKAAKVVIVKDTIHIRKGQLAFDITVLGLSSKRGPATIARTLYEESQDSITKREQERQERSLFYASQKMPAKRPGKKDRRKIREFIRKN